MLRDQSLCFFFQVLVFQLAAALDSGESSTLNLFRCGVPWLEFTAKKLLAMGSTYRAARAAREQPESSHHNAPSIQLGHAEKLRG